MPLIDLQDVSVSYGPRKALENVTLSIGAGAVGLLGLNGAGKSTLLKTLLGFLRAGHGTVTMFGRQMPRHSVKVRHLLGYMPESEVVSPKVSAVSFLAYCGCLFGMSRTDAMERAHEVLNYVGLDSSRYRKMEAYSTGMRQRVKFGQALIHDPKLLLLDEPTSGLDPDGRVEMLELIGQLARTRDVTILLSSHLLPDIEHVCERVIMIHRGHVVSDSTMSDLMSLQEDRYEVRLRARDDVRVFLEKADGAGFACQTKGAHSTVSTDGTIIVSKPEAFDVRDLFAIARDTGAQIRHCVPVRRSLEEVFIRTIKETE